jgi:hypothetical protein
MTGRARVRFVAFAAPRTGSNLMCGMLNAHPQILCHHGLFNPAGIHLALDRRDGCLDLGSRAERDRDPLRFLAAMWNACAAKPVVGFKMNRGECDAAADALLHDPSIRKIVLKRRNRIRTYVSEEIARQTGLWETFVRPASAAIPAIRVDPDELARHIHLNERYYADIEATLRATGQTFIEAHYESLVGDGGDVARILAFLGAAPAAGLPAACHKRGPPDLRPVVANFDALAAALPPGALRDELLSRDVAELPVPV